MLMATLTSSEIHTLLLFALGGNWNLHREYTLKLKHRILHRTI